MLRQHAADPAETKHRMTIRTRKPLISRAAPVAALVCALLLQARTGPAASETSSSGSRNGSTLLVTETVNPAVGETETFLTVPAGKVFLLRQACVAHPQAYITIATAPNFRNDGRLTYGARGCTMYQPGYVVASGQAIGCANRSGLERSCSIMGEMMPDPTASSRRAVIMDVDAALAAEKSAKEKAQSASD
jgi:hypothetical protein